MAKKAKIDFSNPTELRKMTGDNQANYWRRYGITQSGGSRYEQGRKIPSPAKILMALHASGKVSNYDLALARTAAGL